MKCSVFIATSTDGYIADENGGLDWLHVSGNQEADMSDNPDMGFADYLNSVDSMVMGRKCMETISSFNLTPDQWPYGDIKIYVLSNTLKSAPENLSGKGRYTLEVYQIWCTNLTKMAINTLILMAALQSPHF